MPQKINKLFSVFKVLQISQICELLEVHIPEWLIAQREMDRFVIFLYLWVNTA